MTNVMKQAFKKASTGTGYSLTMHAIERIEQRIGIAASEAESWINGVMEKAELTYTKTTDRGIKQGIYEVNGAQIVVDLQARQVVTVTPPKLDTSFLRPIFAREQRKLQREVTRITRSIELKQAELLAEMATNAMNKARAKNPNTRELIQRNIDELEAEISSCGTKIKREQDRLGNFEKVVGAFV